MLILLLVIIFVALIVSVRLSRNIRNFEVKGVVEFVCSFLAVLVGCALLAVSITCFATNVGIEGEIAAYNARYESLVYQLENDIYDNDNDIGKRDLIVDIERWNADLAKGKADQDDLWIGIFVPNIYDEFEFIELG